MPTTTGNRSIPGFGVDTIADKNGVWNRTTTPRTKLYEYWSRTWTRTPGYSNPNRHGLPWNQWGYSRTTQENWEGFTRLTYLTPDKPGYFRTESTGITGSFNEVADAFSSLEQNAAIDEAVGKTLNRVKDSVANWGENIGTAKQSIDMIATALSRIARAMKAVRQGNIARAARALGVSPPGKGWRRRQSGSLANGWLELQYGWLPLLQDIYETTKYFHSKQLKRAPLLRFSGKATRQKNRTVLTQDSSGTSTYIYESKFEAKVVLYFAVQNEQLRQWQQLGITNPLSLAWELLPFSFVIDWALPIGSYFGNLDATLGLKYIKGGYTTCSDCKVTGILESPPGQQVGDFRRDRSLIGRHHKFDVGRQASLAPPSQKVPHFKDPASLMHLANAMALLRQNGGRGSGR